MTEHVYNWAPDLPHMDVRRFIAERLRKEPPSKDLDTAVCHFLGFLGIPPVTQHLGSTIQSIPDGWWWHISHLEAKVIPTCDVPGAPVSNSTLYDFYGRPVGFSAMCHDRTQLPAALCEALLKARYDLPAAFVVDASALAHNKHISRMQSYRQELTERVRAKPKSTLWGRLRGAVGGSPAPETRER